MLDEVNQMRVQAKEKIDNLKTKEGVYFEEYRKRLKNEEFKRQVRAQIVREWAENDG